MHTVHTVHYIVCVYSCHACNSATSVCMSSLLTHNQCGCAIGVCAWEREACSYKHKLSIMSIQLLAIKVVLHEYTSCPPFQMKWLSTCMYICMMTTACTLIILQQHMYTWHSALLLVVTENWYLSSCGLVQWCYLQQNRIQHTIGIFRYWMSHVVTPWNSH